MSNYKPYTFSEIFFNDFYKYINKNKQIKLLNKKYEYSPNSKINSLKKDKDKIIFDVTYNINEHGYRFCKCNPIAKDTYIFTGCSVIFGIGLNDNETLPYYFSELLDFKYNILNIAFPGGGIHTTLEEFNNPKFYNLVNSKNIKYVFLNLSNDHIFRAYIGRFQDNVFRIKNNRITLQPKSILLKSKFFDTMIFDRNFCTLFNLYNKSEAFDLSIALLKKLNYIIKNKYKAKFIVFSYENNPVINDIFNKLKQYDINCIPIKINYPDKPNGYYSILGDGHPTANLNKEAADILFNYIKQKNE